MKTGQTGGFTLIEMLVVIAIIGILVGLLLPVIWHAQKKAKVARAKREIIELEEAWSAYQLQYKRFPNFLVTKMDSNALAVLRGGNASTNMHPENPRNVPFLDIRYTTLYYCDPWGVPGTDQGVYRIRLDTNGANMITLNGKDISVSIAVWSCGPNRVDEFGDGDDICSWKD